MAHLSLDGEPLIISCNNKRKTKRKRQGMYIVLTIFIFLDKSYCSKIRIEVLHLMKGAPYVNLRCYSLDPM